ncbi:hypothetical protein PUV54_10770 [Hyphococcus flavus]|uniref:Glutamine amidotransferase domain-containing protein n=1 Tax=Hyphococcus flavus TaxID=1866326 RepID=A0AAE9ZBS9_9PROT|nr:hypothetical protein [Hyphococcus flavus]WDI30440.1 hypothetical protein PUV54_10770 [Hyphococcus flavus]
MNIVFDPWLPHWALVLTIFFGATVILTCLVRNWRSGIPRMLAVVAVILLIANPLRREAETTPLDDVALILVDESASQTLDSRDAVTQDATTKLQESLTNLSGVETIVSRFTGADETLAVASLSQSLADIPRNRLAGVFVVTDGQAADAADAKTFPPLEAPVHIFTTGAQNEVDRKINLVTAPRYGIVRQSVRVTFRVDDLGPNEILLSDRQSAQVTLRIDGAEILSERVPVGTEAGFDVPLDRPGQLIIELEVEERRGELTTRNNIAVLPITAVRDRLRVLLISGEPHPGERVWRNLLKSDAAVDLVHFTILRPIDKNDGTPVEELALIPFPQDELFIDKLEEFDLLIFDRYAYRGVLSSFHFDNIARFVDNGGAVLIASGPEYNSSLSLAGRRNLSFILPALPSGGAVEETYRPEVTELGKRHPVTADLDDEDIWGRWLRLIPVTQTRGQTLMSGANDGPLLILDRVGEGRVGLFLSDHVWLWARGFDGGGPHTELLRRIAHWLMKEPELEEEALALRTEGKNLVVERRTIENSVDPVMITRPDGATEEISLAETTPGDFTARIENAQPGLYRATSGDLFAIGSAGLETTPEFQDVVSTNAKLEPISNRSGGGVFNVRRSNGANLPEIRRVRENAPDFAGHNWAGLAIRNAERVETVRDAPFAPAIVWLAVIALSLLAAWAIEGGRVRSAKNER